MELLFCSRNPTFRNPVGALPAGGNLHVKIRLPRSIGCSAAILQIRCDSDHDSVQNSMFWCGMDGWDHEWWECDFQPPKPGIYWYSFRLQTSCGPQAIHRTTGGYGSFDSAEAFQLTVYDPDFRTPDWLSGGVMYQIFPDRFACSGTPKPPIPAGRHMHADWGEQPKWQPDADGEIRNNDYFGGDLRGITDRLDDLQALGVTCIYLNPIFEAHSNHRYDTADYEKIDPLLGDADDLRALCEAAKQRGMRVILDGVFNHTGSDSRYFNRYGRYPEPGAFQSKESPYYDWYDFTQWPLCYASWWGFETLPSIRHGSQSFHQYITGPDGIAARWVRCGTAGWRLDVVDELPDTLIDRLRVCVKRTNPEAILLGEVWEDASNKESYGQRRRYLLGAQLDSVMNYPFRSGLLHYFLQQDASRLAETVESILEHYPPQVVRLLMNPLGTHDTERALTVLGGEPARGRGREWQASHPMTPEQRALGLRRLRAAAAVQFCLPGVPSIYYGDEAGLAGYADPFNRGCYPWGRVDEALRAHFAALGAIRRRCACLREGAFACLRAEGGTFVFTRTGGGDALLCACNAANAPIQFPLPPEWADASALLGAAPQDGTLALDGMECAILYRKTDA